MPDPTDPGLVILSNRADAMSVFDAQSKTVIAMLRAGEEQRMAERHELAANRLHREGLADRADLLRLAAFMVRYPA